MSKFLFPFFWFLEFNYDIIIIVFIKNIIMSLFSAIFMGVVGKKLICSNSNIITRIKYNIFIGVILMTDLDTLKSNMLDEDYEIRKQACIDLEEYGNEAIDILIEAFSDKNPHVRFQAAKSLANIGDEVINPVLEKLKEDDPQVQKYAVLTLKSLGNDSVAAELIGALDSDDFAIRKFAAKTLGEMEVVDAVEPIIELLTDEDWGVRASAANALGDIKDKRAIDPIKKARRAATGDKEFKKVCNKSLKKIDPKPKKKKAKK